MLRMLRCSQLANMLCHRCAILVLRLTKTSAGIAGKHSGRFGVWPETANAAAHRSFCILTFWLNAKPVTQEDALVALAGRPVKWTGLAVQQQRFEPDSNAD
jgi:hypothetical protein